MMSVENFGKTIFTMQNSQSLSFASTSLPGGTVPEVSAFFPPNNFSAKIQLSRKWENDNEI